MVNPTLLSLGSILLGGSGISCFLAGFFMVATLAFIMLGLLELYAASKTD